MLNGGILTFIAIDFETADHGPDSACAIGLVRVADDRIVNRRHYLVRPPRQSFFFSDIHGITWEKVCGEPTFAALWPEIQELVLGADFLASHGASFDRRVLRSCCQMAKVPLPQLPHICTLKLARNTWGIRPTSLSIVCRHLGLRLNHHEALSDAEACAAIVLAARESGVEICLS
jgi:DNA polymerase-3 subunit epsilon